SPSGRDPTVAPRIKPRPHRVLPPGGPLRMARFRRAHGESDDDLPPSKVSGRGLREALRLAGYLRPYWLRFVAAVAALALSSVLGLAFPFVTGKLVNAALPGAGRDVSLLGDWSIDAIAAAMMVVLAFQALFSF